MHRPDRVSLAAIGIRQPVPNARSVTFRPGAACLRLNSAIRTSRSTRSTVAAIEARGDDLVGRLMPLDVPLQDVVEHVVRRQRILIRLIRPQLGRRRLGQRRLRNHRPPRRLVPPPRHAVHHRLRHVGDHRRGRRTCRRTACSSRPTARTCCRSSAAARRAVFESAISRLPRIRAWMFSCGDAGRIRAERARSVPSNARITASIGSVIVSMPRFARQLVRIVEAALARIGRRHQHAEHAGRRRAPRPRSPR